MVTRRRMLQAAASLPACGGIAGFANVIPALTSAPIAGHFTHESVRLWLQASVAVTATIVYWPENAKEENARRIDLKLTDNNACAAIASMGGLAADSRYRFTVLLDDAPTGLMRSFRTSPAPGSVAADFRVYLGSCAYTEAMAPNGNPYGDEFHIFDAMAEAARTDRLPHFMIWLGDNLYFRPKGHFLAEADVASVSRMETRYRHVRSLKLFQQLFAATHHYAIWDDHDFGPNDSDKSFKYKTDALRLFKQYWPNPEMGSSALPGTWTKFTHQDAEFFLLDDRTYRDAENAPPSESKTMFGAAQIAWLKNSLKDSRATFKLIANGSQLLSDHDNGHHSGWHSHAAERNAFLAWLAAEKISGLVFLSGDRHNTQVFRLAQSGVPTVYEFSCSPLTSRLSKLDRRERANPRLVKELTVEKRNFGSLEFSGYGVERKLIARCFDSNAKLLWEKLIASARFSGSGEPV